MGGKPQSNTSLVAYKLIGHVLDKFLLTEDRNGYEMTRYYLLAIMLCTHSCE